MYLVEMMQAPLPALEIIFLHPLDKKAGKLQFRSDTSDVDFHLWSDKMSDRL